MCACVCACVFYRKIPIIRIYTRTNKPIRTPYYFGGGGGTNPCPIILGGGGTFVGPPLPLLYFFSELEIKKCKNT